MSHIHKFHERIVFEASLGTSMKTMAEKLGVSYGGIWQYSKRHGIEFQRPYPSRPKLARDAEILAAFNDGKTLESIGQQFGITRERVRQIVEKAGAVPRLDQITAKNDALRIRLQELANTGMSAKDAAKAGDVKYSKIRRGGVKFKRKTFASENQELVASLAERVRNGESIRALSKGRGTYCETVLQRYCAANGIIPKTGRWRDFSSRRAIVSAMLGQGLSWDTIAAAVNAIDGTDLGRNSIYHWSRLNGLIPPRKPRQKVVKMSEERCAVKVPKERRAVPILPDGNGHSIREYCVAHKDAASASQIAAKLGITRNAVIGHWHKHKKSGVAP